MKTLDLRENIALAFDGGGVRGIIPAMALCELEAGLQPPTADKTQPLIDSGRLRVICGTSSGAIIAAGVALGLTCAEMIQFQDNLIKRIFPHRVWIGWALGMPARYDADIYKDELRKIICEKLGNADATIEDLHNQKLKNNGTVLIITTMDVHSRRTKFIKSDNLEEKGEDKDKDWKLWEAIMASSAAPTYFPVIEHRYRTIDPDTKQPIEGKKFFVDGGTGSYNDPAYIAAREVVEWQNYSPQDVSLLSFGTGSVPDSIYRQTNPHIDRWMLINWAKTMTFDLLMTEASRAQALDVLQHFVKSDSDGNIDMAESMDFRRFQVALPRDIDLDDSSAETSVILRALGAQLAKRIQCGEYLRLATFKHLGEQPDENVDPSGIARQWLKIIEKKVIAAASTV